jgi:hypothetical protein
MHLLSQAKNNVSALALMRHLGVSYPTVWLVKHKLMQVMAERERARVLEGRVEIDDAYLGGEHPGGRRGRGSENKVPFVVAVQTSDDGHHPIYVSLARIPFTSEAIERWVRQTISASAHIVSDGLHAFRVLAQGVDTHERHIVGGGVAAFTHPQFRACGWLSFIANHEGKWLYLEHDWVAEEGSYIFEPPGETHTLVVPDDGKEMITMFQVNGTLVCIDPHGKTLRYDDMFTRLERAREQFKSVGLGADYVQRFVR